MAGARGGAGARWEFWIDRGGTFTDCIGRDPSGALHTVKRLSSDAAPVEGIRALLERSGALAPGQPLPRCQVKLGSTVATNALLERRGVPTVLVGQQGLLDVFRIGTQERPELFELDIRRSPPLHTWSVGVGARQGVDGTSLAALDEADLVDALGRARAAGARSAAVVLLHAYADPTLEDQVAAIARAAGFEHVVASSEIAREMGYLGRGETTIADAYLTPLLRTHTLRLAEALPGSRLRFMQSSGGLTEAVRFRGPAALLSGPAGGVVAAARVAQTAGFRRAIGFDMGGTSTDVSLIVDGEVDRAFETTVGGVRVKSPMLRIHTVAAGGGSLCRFDGFSLSVGPDSAGADPGPLSYGRTDGGGHLRATELALTDVNLYLGRLQPDRFPFAVDGAPVEAALRALQHAIAEAGTSMDLDAVAAGFAEVANASMAQAIAQVSVARGVDPRECALVGFGGAGGQHVCAIARILGIRTVLLHPLAGVLSAYGIGVAEESWDGQRDAGRVPLGGGIGLPREVEAALEDLERAGCEALTQEGLAREGIRIERSLDLRYVGTDSALSIALPTDPPSGWTWADAFADEHARRFGYRRPDRPIEVVTARVRARGPEERMEGPRAESGTEALPEPVPPRPEPVALRTEPVALRTESVWCPGTGRVETPVFAREALGPGTRLAGPAVVVEDSGTVVLDPGFVLRVSPDGVAVVTDEAEAASLPSGESSAGSAVDPVRLEVFGNRFMSIAEQMGAVLRNTAVSTNIKERLDYSCAVFDGDGGLVANAPHIPVHLGAMGETVKAVLRRFPDLAPGDMVVTNDPFEGGSHLPDVTVVTPVFLRASPDSAVAPRPAYFTASRGHHAEIGGVTPGSMPPDSHTLSEEGVVLHPFRLVRGGVFDEATLRDALAAGPHPSRRPDDNVADLAAMVAANRTGEHLLSEFAAEEGEARVDLTMRQLQEAAAAKVAREIQRMPDGESRFADRMDDGTPVCVRLTVSGDRMRIDFEGTGPASVGNLNAPRAVVQAAVIYVLRSLVSERIPLNGGCLEPVDLRIPPGCLLDPPPGSAVVGGNVETSQRVVDVLLGALGRVAASQGTMNNVTFGDDDFGYYETIGGGAGAGPDFAGASGVHTHMTNTRITDPEVLEARYPVRLLEFALRAGSGGRGRAAAETGSCAATSFSHP